MRTIEKLNNKRLYTIAWGVVFLFLWLYAIYAHHYFGNYDVSIALRGFTPLDFTNYILYPENFIRDYPGGSWSIGNSLLPWIYPLLTYLGVSVEGLFVFIRAIEILVMNASAMYLMRTLYNNIHPLALFSLAALISLSWIQMSNLSNMGNTTGFYGQFHGFAEGLRLVAIALYLRERHRSAALILILGFTVHPLKIIYGAFFILGMHAWRYRSFFDFKFIAPYLTFVLFACLWLWLWLGVGDSDVNNSLSKEEFFRYSPLLNSHWYPQDLGIFGKYHYYYATPFLSAVLMLFSILARNELSDERTGQIIFGVIFVLILSFIGVIFSYYDISISITKASFQRASILILAMATIMVVAQTVKDIFDERYWFALLGVLILGAAFFIRAAWPVVLVSIYTILVFFDNNLRNRHSLWLFKILSISLLVIISYEIVLYFLGFQNISIMIKPLRWLLTIVIIYAVTRFFIRFVFKSDTSILNKKIFIFIVVIGISIGGYNWSSKNRIYSNKHIENGYAYKSVQEWAKNNTSVSSLFMVDPCIAYGWRDFSARSSFGGIHEWYKTGWLYTGNQDSLHEGIKRGSLLNIDINIIVPHGKRQHPGTTYSHMCNTARKSFYQQDGSAVANITSNYDIQYVVMDKTQARKYGDIPVWKKAFENKHYVVLIPPHNQEN